MSLEETLQPWAIADLPLHKLISAARKIPLDGLPEIRLAIMGNAATQHLHQALTAVLKLRGFSPVVYEAEFDMIEHEVRAGDSALFTHRPDFVIMHMATQALWERFAGSDNKAGFAEEILSELLASWTAIRRRCGALIVQQNFVVPVNRPFGNRTGSTSASFVSAIQHLNELLARVDTAGLVVVDAEFQAAYYGKRQWLDERLWCQARQALSPAFLPPLVKAFSDAILLDRGVGIKCVIVDLDNTIWGGVLADDGIEKIEIGQTELGLAFLRFQRSLAELRDRGILLAACSKNDQENVLNVLNNHPDMLLRASDFSIVVASYDDKVSNIMRIQKSLNIGFDSMVFFDDTPFERDLVRSALPALQVPELSEDPAQFLSQIAHWNLFEGRPATQEDLARTGYYQADAARAEIREKYVGLDDFITNLGMKAQIQPVDGYTLPRALQLVQRSNQFNLTTIRHSEEALRAFALSDEHRAFCIRLGDRLGDNGIIAVVIVRKEGRSAIVDTWIMSCRVLGRKVEDLTLQQIVVAARSMDCDRIVGQYRPTAKNDMVKDLFPSLGFSGQSSSGETRLFSLDLSRYEAKSIPITIISNTEAEYHE